ncbi:MAG: M23 family metallopeptidase [Ignavibacteria bacterium]
MKKILIVLFVLTAYSAQSQVEQVGENLFMNSDKDSQKEENCGNDNKFIPGVYENYTGPRDASSLSFIWPLDAELNKGNMIVNYIDHLSGSSIKDYDDGTWTYDEHHGTDICLYDFTAMDKFTRIKAAANGTVVKMDFDNFDRNTAWADGLHSNYVVLRHDDGTYAKYLHLMKKSVTVKLGEYVLQGQTLGYVGSSGYSTDAHLHFEPGYYFNDEWVVRDPWQGAYNHAPSLWEDQYSYAGNYDFRLHDMGVYTVGQVGGNFNNTLNYVKERIITPNTVSGYESKIGFWMQFQGNYTGYQVKFELRRSDGGLMNSTSFYVAEGSQHAWIYWTPDFNYGIDHTGDWYVRVLYNNVEKGRAFFNVQLLTSNRPRLYPSAGKCFRKSIFIQKDTLRVRPVRTNMQYELLNAPAGVSIVQDSIIQIGAVTQTLRERKFQVIASIGGSATLRDTMSYDIIDTTKNILFGNGLESLELHAKLEGFWNGTTMVEDTVTVIVRAPLYPYNIVDSAKVFLDDDGYALANFFHISSGVNYWLVVKHRNSIETWSKATMQFTTNDPISYDFTTSAAKAYGNNLKLKNSEYCFYGGDVNQNGSVNLTDLVAVYNDATAFATGYRPTDVTGNNITNLNDIVITQNNSIAFVVKVRP